MRRVETEREDDVATILISYRRSDTAGLASTTRELLARHFGDHNVALDQPSPDTDSADRLSDTEVLVVLVGDQWLAEDETGSVALHTDGDPIADLLHQALRGPARILLLMAPDVERPTQDELPEALLEVAMKPAFQLTEEKAASLEPLIEEIEETFKSRSIEWRSTDTGFSDQDWDALIANIKRGKLVPFLGGGLSPDATRIKADLAADWADKFGYHRPADLIELAASEEPDAQERLARRWAREFARVVQFVKVKNSQDQLMANYALSERLEKLKISDAADKTAPYRILADLPLAVYLTTNQDAYLEAALQEQPNPRIPMSDRYRPSEAIMPEQSSRLHDPSFELKATEPVVYHLYGTSGDHHAESMILSEDDYLSFAVGVTSDQTTLPQAILHAIGKGALLFLGFDWDDLGFRALLHAILPRFRHGVSNQLLNVAVQVSPDADPGMIDYVKGYFNQQWNLSLYPGKPEEFTDELRRRWGETAAIS